MITPALVILLHSSKTMRSLPYSGAPLRQPELLDKARKLGTYLKTLSPQQLATSMHISSKLASSTYALVEAWTAEPGQQTSAIDSFIGDIYSGLRAGELSKSDRNYADRTLWILSGLYGFLRPQDGICPYRLEMGYKLPDPRFRNLYDFWGKAVAERLPAKGLIVNVSSKEYIQAILPFVDQSRIITPDFLTVDPKTHIPTFRTIHAKIARGAFARWLITSRATEEAQFSTFNDLGYAFNKRLSAPNKPVFVCETFEGRGLSIRLT